MEQIMIVGAGSVGGFFGAYLAKNNPKRVILIEAPDSGCRTKRGLTIRSAGGSFTVRPPAASDPA